MKLIISNNSRVFKETGAHGICTSTYVSILLQQRLNKLTIFER